MKKLFTISFLIFFISFSNGQTTIWEDDIPDGYNSNICSIVKDGIDYEGYECAGSKVWKTNGYIQINPQNNYWFQMSDFNTIGYSNVVLRISENSRITEEQLIIQISTDDGSSWADAEIDYTGWGGYQVDGYIDIINLPATADLTIRITNSNNVQYKYFRILDLTLTGYLPPTVTTNGPTGVQATQAVLNGILDTEGDGLSDQGFFYAMSSGVSASSDKVSAGFGSGTGAYHHTLACQPSTTYYYKAFAQNPYATVLGAEQSFTTLPNQPGQPQLSNVDLTSVDLTIATNGNPIGTEYAIYCVTTNKYLSPSGYPDQGSAIWKSDWEEPVNIKGLVPQTGYTFEVIAKNSNGDQAMSPQATATTNAVPSISISNDGEVVDIMFADYTPNTVTVQYKTSEGGTFVDVPAGKLTITATKATINGLSPQVVYWFRIIVTIGVDDYVSVQSSPQPIGVSPPEILRAYIRLQTAQLTIEFSKDVDLTSIVPANFTATYKGQPLDIIAVYKGSINISFDEEIVEPGDFGLSIDTNIPAAAPFTPDLSQSSFNAYFAQPNAVIFQQAVPLSNWSIVGIMIVIIGFVGVRFFFKP